jgi:hypothetical protein
MKTTSTNVLNKVIGMIALIILISSQNTQAQNWPQPGATWEYCFFPQSIFESEGTATFAYSADTVLQGVEYAVIRWTFYNTEPIQFETPVDYERRLYVRMSNDTIYRFVAGSEYILFVNGLEIGDSFTTFRTAPYNHQIYSCQELMELEVVDVVETEISGNILRYVYMIDSEFGNLYENSFWINNGEGLYHLFIENVGFGGALTPLNNGTETSDYAFSFRYANAETCDFASDADAPMALNKYWDNQTLLDFGQCLSVSVNEIPETSVSIHPNPSCDYVYIQLKQQVNEPLSYTVFDISGRIVQSGSITNTAQPGFDVQTLPSGSYLINIQSMDQRFVSRFVKN